MPPLIEQFFDALYAMSLEAIIIWSLVENVLILVVVLVIGHFLVKRYANHPITEEPEPLTLTEILFAGSCVLLNAVVTIVGILLWREGIIRVHMGAEIWRVILDSLVLFFGMDLLMYVFHRVAHNDLLYPLLHSTHHRFENPRPLTLFVLNPAETLGFGGLWLMLLVIYPASWLAIMIYLTLNIVFGLVGHLGVEPMPNPWIHIPFINYISTSTFHAEHHVDKDHNYGFYTLIWDRLFGTISPDYDRDFTSARDGSPIPDRN